jgi:hypothetical protein
MQYRAWRSGREIVSYQEGDLRCDFTCTHASAGQPQVLYLHDRCKVGGAERKLTAEERARVELRVCAHLAERRLLGLKVGTREVHVVHQQSL